MQGTNLLICSVYDSKAEAYFNPFYLRSEGEAIRAFGDQVKREGTPIHDHPEDFVLFLVGTFDQSTGIISPITPRALTKALDFVKGE